MWKIKEVKKISEEKGGEQINVKSQRDEARRQESCQARREAKGAVARVYVEYYKRLLG